MDRRGFLRLAGIGGAVASVAPVLILPTVQKLAVPDPQRRFFLPPANGWVTGVDWASGPDEQIWAWGTNEPAREVDGYFRTETTYDIETFDMPAGKVFAFNPSDTVRVEFGSGAARQSGVMFLERIDYDYSSGHVRLRGRGVESFYGSNLGAPIATIKATRATVRRSLVPSLPTFTLSGVYG